MNISKIRRSLLRSRTPTGSEMKQQNSLEVSQQIRSASFDERQLNSEPQASSSSPNERSSFNLLKVPYLGPKRSKSFDAGCDDVDDTETKSNNTSMDKSSYSCIHCKHLDQLGKRLNSEGVTSTLSLDFSSFSSRDEVDDDWDDESNDDLNEVICGIKVTLSPNSPSSPNTHKDISTAIIVNRPSSPKSKTMSPKLERQPAIVCMSADLSSQENSLDISDPGCNYYRSQSYLGSSSEYGDNETCEIAGSEPSRSRRPSMAGLRATRSAEECKSDRGQQMDYLKIHNDQYLNVPSRRDRAVSLDLPFTYPSTEDLQANGTNLVRSISLEPPSSFRSRMESGSSEDSSYKVMVTPPSADRTRKAITSEVELRSYNGEKRVLRATCDFSESALNGDHLWSQTSASGDFCYVGDEYCCKAGSRMKCSACKIICHTGCISGLLDKVKFACKPTFRDVGPRQYREHTETHHHWVHRRNQKGKCKSCFKSFQSKLLFGSKEIVAISCSWCKAAYHNKESCFDIAKIGETCNLGLHHTIIVPPSWIVKLPRRGSFKSSLRKSPKKRSSTKRKSKEKSDREHRPFAIKPIPNANVKPLVVFINPKSGGNQGAKLMQKFLWLLNPRQVFDLTQGGPRTGLEMFRKAPNLRVLACGGDGTVGWILSILDQISIDPPPSVGVLPLGTGNDLARALGWGGGYTDEPISKILCNIADGEIVYLDRWKLEVEKNPDYGPTEDGKDSLPLNVVNNYFSFGADAQISLEFHEAREANPQKFTSRLRNKMFYGQAGGKDLLQRKWKDLCELVTLECDGKDVTHLLKEYKVHAVVFLNIQTYGSGTHPWNPNSGSEQLMDDGLIEVVGLTTYQMPLLQAGGHGTSIAQCRRAKLVTKKTIPMQVDGEACRINPSIIVISHLNKAAVITKTKAKTHVQPHLEQLRLEVSSITMYDYEQFHYDKEKLRAASAPLIIIVIDQDADLEQVRKHINRMLDETPEKTSVLSENWCFVDSCTAERFFRIDKAQESLHYVTDICTEELYVLDMDVREHSAKSPGIPVPRDISVDNDADHTERLMTMVYDDYCVNPPFEYSEDQKQSQILEKTSELTIKAAKTGDLKMLKDLCGQGYSLMSIDPQGQTALHYAARLGHKDIVRFIIASAHPAILDISDKERGQTALHLAAAHRRRTICCMLIAAGASMTIKDCNENTPRALALQAEDRELAAYLESQEQFQSVMNEDFETTV